MTRFTVPLLALALALTFVGPGGISAAAETTQNEQAPAGTQGPASRVGTMQTAPVPPPLPPLEQSQPPELAAQYYVEQDGAPAGPYALDQVKQLIAAGKVQRTTRVWKTGTADWVSADTIEEINLALQLVPPEVAPQAKFEAYIIGTWEGAFEGEHGLINRVSLRYERDGSFAGIIETWVPSVPNPTYTPLAGTWSIKSLGTDRFTLTTKLEDGKESTGALRIIDADTVENDLGIRSTRVSR
jgi:hypothetical protein